MIEVIVREENNQIHAFNKAGHGYFDYNTDQFYTEQIPDQDVDQFYEGEPPSETLKEIYYPDDVKTQFDSPFLETDATYYATIADIDASRSDKKYVKVKRTINGEDVSAWCYVTYSMLQAYQSSDLEQGDYVIVNFVDNDLDKPIILDKVIGF